jgi:hypothetical protein
MKFEPALTALGLEQRCPGISLKANRFSRFSPKCSPPNSFTTSIRRKILGCDQVLLFKAYPLQSQPTWNRDCLGLTIS